MKKPALGSQQKNNNLNISFLASLPRSGGTLLSSILSENKNIYTTGNSPLAQLMWDAQISCENIEPMVNYPELQDKYLSSIPYILYENINAHVLDKTSTWGLPGNITMIHRYITKQPKFIVTIRPLVEIVKSIVYIRKMNNWNNPESGLLDEGTDPIMRSYSSFKNLIEQKDIDVLFIKYDDLLSNTEQQLHKVYNFLKLEKFKHNLSNIKNRNQENDKALNLVGLHDIRKNISKRNVDINLSFGLEKKANHLDLYNQIK